MKWIFNGLWNIHALLVSNCGGALEASTSSHKIVLPNFPDYALNCTWIVTASEPSSRVNITVNYPRDVTRCHQDYLLYIYEGRFLNCYTKKYGKYIFLIIWKCIRWIFLKNIIYRSITTGIINYSVSTAVLLQRLKADGLCGLMKFLGYNKYILKCLSPNYY